MNAMSGLGATGDVLGAIAALGFGGILGNVGIGYLSGVDPRTGFPIWEETDSPEIKDAKRNGWVARSLIPSTYSQWLPPFSGNDVGGASYEATVGTGLDRRGMPTMGTGDVVLRQFGINVRRVDAAYEFSKRMRTYDFQLREVQANITRISRDQRLTPERQDAAIRRQQENYDRIIQDRIDYVESVQHVLDAEDARLSRPE
jgi:hypothetical protein